MERRGECRTAGANGGTPRASVAALRSRMCGTAELVYIRTARPAVPVGLSLTAKGATEPVAPR